MSLFLRRASRSPLLRLCIAPASSRTAFISGQSRTPAFRIWNRSELCSGCAFSTYRRLQSAAARDVNEIVEELEELYDAAREEFQIAAEETEENTIYAADDRTAAREHLEKLQSTYDGIVENHNYPQGVREEVKRRAGQRVRELANAMEALEEKAQNQD